ncbi:hypothetical protein [Aeromonas veronii]|uniref:hypothetical protein n=1 Tax=Aeromonas veronii TaxID=654 RepID=UPI003D1D97D5
MDFYFSKSTGGFYNNAVHGKGMPSDAIKITAEYHSELMQGQSDGLSIVADDTGFPVLASPINSAVSKSEVEALRAAAYADPTTGSDRYFNEASRMQAMGESGWEEVKNVGIARYKEIQQQYPWPEE